MLDYTRAGGHTAVGTFGRGTATGVWQASSILARGNGLRTAADATACEANVKEVELTRTARARAGEADGSEWGWR